MNRIYSVCQKAETKRHTELEIERVLNFPGCVKKFFEGRKIALGEINGLQIKFLLA